ncbi:carbohydrate ABC transporter permease [Carnobacterium jeotgali]|uniref:carbohydrate ABC transporter permease n=1 Tax=Carnobacterium jeotgali TaxID=545534 RepID=UPI00388E7E56
MKNDKLIAKRQRMLIYIFFGILTFLSIIPFWIVLANGTRSSEQIQQGISLFAGSNLKYNWDVLMNKGFDIFGGYTNSFIIASLSTILTLYFSSLTAYGLTAYKFKGKSFMFSMIMFLILIPPQVSMVGFYQFMSKLGLLNSYIPLIIPAIAAPSTVFFMKQYLETVYQKEIADSARMDGAGEFKIFHTIILPLLKPGLATMGIFSFVGSWNNFLMPLVLINEQDKYTLPMLMQLLKTDTYRTEYGSMYLGISLSIVPLLLIYLLLSRYIIGGVSAGGVKG